MRNTLVAGIGGLVVGHTLWLLATSVAMGTKTVNGWVLAVAAGSLVLCVLGAVLGLIRYRQHSYAWAAFLWCLPVSPVIFTLAVLGATYL